MKGMAGAALVAAAIGAGVWASAFPGAARSEDGAGDDALQVGSKKFTESVILGEIAAHRMRAAGHPARHRGELGGTRILWNALLAGEIDVYAEYTGTIRQEILADRDLGNGQPLAPVLAEFGLRMTMPLGFNNTYALGMRKSRALELGVRRISDLVDHPDLAFGFTSEFMDRGDGWPSLRDAYELPQENVRGLDHDLAYIGLADGAIDVMDLYSTDAEIRHYDLRVLDDDRRHFPAYQAVYLYRADLEERAPRAVAALRALEGRISEDRMIAMNARAKIDRVPEVKVAADFLRQTLGEEVQVRTESATGAMLRHTREHLALVGISLGAAVLVAFPLGLLAAKRERLGQTILAVVGIVQTIPSLALLALMVPILGIGGPPAVVALFLYSLLPIVRNTYAGLHDIPVGLRESAMALGLPAWARIRRIEIPMASRAILAGIKTSAVINVGTATLAALIGAGGYGQPIFTGIRLNDKALILQGAIPAGVLALVAQGLFEVVEAALVSKGLRLKPVE